MQAATPNYGQYSTFAPLDCKSAVLSLNFWFLDTKFTDSTALLLLWIAKNAVLSLNFWFLDTKI